MTDQSFSMQWTGLGVSISVLIVVVTSVLCWLSWSRHGYSKRHGILELIRLATVAAVAFTINQPEWLQEYRPNQTPTVAVLWDNSNSMTTEDVIDEERPAAAPQSRQDWVAPFLDNQAIWNTISERFEVMFEPFSSTSGNVNEGTDLHKALSDVLGNHPNLRSVVMFSDGDWNQGDAPIRAASRLRMKNVPVFAVSVGSQTRLPDVEVVSLDAPTFGVVGKPMRIPFAVRSSLTRDQNVTVSLTSSAGDEVTKQVKIPAMGRLEDALRWTPTNVGDFQLTLRVPVHQDELLKENNVRTEPIVIRKESLNVLVVETFPRWEYRYLRNALERDPGVEVSCLLFHPGLSKAGGGRGYLKEFPNSLEELAKYDVIFLGDVGVDAGQLTAEQCRLIKGLVQSQASGLVLIPGRRGNQLSLLTTEMKEIYPVTLDAGQPMGWGSRIPYQFELTESGRRSLLTKLADSEDANAEVWEGLPGFQWYAPVVRANPGSEILAVHKSESNRSGRLPLLVTKTFGTGKILFMGTDGAWRWREGVEDRFHYRFWGQVARWMAYQRNMAKGDSMRLFYSPDRPQAGKLVTLNANVMSNTGEPLSSGRVSLQIIAPSGRTDTLRLGATDGEWGLFTGNFTPEESGEYQMIMTCRESGGTLETSISVHGVEREQIGQPARFDVLEEIASVTDGKMVKPTDVQKILDEIADLPEPDPISRRLRIWCHPVWASVIVTLLGVFWVGRKIVGVI